MRLGIYFFVTNKKFNMDKWKKYIIQFNPEVQKIEGIFPSSSEVPGQSSQTIASKARTKNKTPGEDGLIYYRLGEFQELFPDLLQSHLRENYPVLPSPPLQKSLNLVLTIGGKIVSVNDLYKARLVYAGGRPKPAIYKNPKAKEVASEIYRQLQSVDITEYIPWLEKTKAYKISIQFVVKTGISRRDTENLGKNIIDTVVRYIRSYSGITHFDDSEFLEVYFTKSIIPGAKHEYALINLVESSHNPRFDYIPTPEKFYLGGWLGDRWKEEIIQELEAKGKGWYAPELNLSSGCEEEWGIEQEKKCNTYLEIFDFGNLEERKEDLRRIMNLVHRFEHTRPVDKFLYIGFTGTMIGGEYRYLEEEISRLGTLGIPGLVVKYISEPKELIMELGK